MDRQNHKDPTLHLPRILCLHGGGTNARIFRAQCRSVSRMLEQHYHLAYAEAPYECGPGPDVALVYAEEGPFKRWLRWLPEHAPLDDLRAIEAIDDSIMTAMAEDDAAGATGPWVGLLGFSQGAKLAASLLFRQQVRKAQREEKTRRSWEPAWRFAVVMAGRAPITNLDPKNFQSSLLSDPSDITLQNGPNLNEMSKGEHILRLPTVHVHGLTDPGLHLHQELYEQYCDHKTAKLVEWPGHHRVPLKTTDVQPVVDAIMEVSYETGVFDE